MTHFLLLAALLVGPVPAGQSEIDTVTSASRQALKEVDGAPPAERPAVAKRCADALSKLAPASEEARAIVQAEALHLLVHAGQMREVFSGANNLKPGDPAWKRLLPILLEASERQNDYSELARIASALKDQAQDSEIRQTAALAAGESLWRAGQVKQARLAFEAAVKAAPESRMAAEALRRLRELKDLAPGNPAPDFKLTARDGTVLSKASVMGKPALLYFWASWCGTCKEHIPMLAGLKDVYGERLLLAGISLDTDCSAAAKWARSAGMSWPMACDGSGDSGPVAKAFAVGGAPELVLIDRQGSIAGKNVPYDRLRAVVAEIVEEPQAGRYAQELVRESRMNLPEVMSALGVKPGSQVADVGAGHGFLTLRLAGAVGRSGKVFAVDIDEKALGELRKRVARAGLENVVAIRSTESNPMLPDGTLDAVVVLRAYHEVVPYREMLARIRAALRPGGRLVIIDSGSAGQRERSRAEQVARHELDMAFAKREVAEAGFTVVRSAEKFPSGDGGGQWLVAAERPPERAEASR